MCVLLVHVRVGRREVGRPGEKVQAEQEEASGSGKIWDVKMPSQEGRGKAWALCLWGDGAQTPPLGRSLLL